MMASPAIAQVTAEEALANARQLSAERACDRSDDPNEIVVCGRDRSDRYRLPLPVQRAPGALRSKGEMPRASADARPDAPCGIFEGHRRCSKSESLHYGYGGGKDPLSALIKLGTKLLDPDADVEPPAPLSRR